MSPRRGESSLAFECRPGAAEYTCIGSRGGDCPLANAADRSGRTDGPQETLSDVWEQGVARNSTSTPFESQEWIESYVDQVGVDPPHRLCADSASRLATHGEPRRRKGSGDQLQETSRKQGNDKHREAAIKPALGARKGPKTVVEYFVGTLSGP